MLRGGRAVGSAGLAALLAAATLAACSGEGDALDQAASREVLLSAEDLPLDGYTQGKVAEDSKQSGLRHAEGLPAEQGHRGPLRPVPTRPRPLPHSGT